MKSFWRFRRIKAIRILATFKHESVVELIGACIKDRSWRIRYEAIDALAKLDNHKIVQYLITACKKSDVNEKDKVLKLAVETLIIKGEKGMPVVETILDELIDQSRSGINQSFI